MATVTQTKRSLSIDTPLGQDKLLVQAFSGSEGVSQLFHYHLELLSEDGGLKPDGIVGKPVTVTVERRDGSPQYFNGVVSSFALGGQDDRFTRYEAEMVPWLWLLTRTSDSRIFQKKKVPDVITQIFGEYGLSDFQKKLTGNYTEWDYLVQYRETDFNFLSRIMEHEGIFYYFKQENGKHTLVLGDSPQAFQDTTQSKVEFRPEGGWAARDKDAVFTAALNRELRPGKHTLREYNFQKPGSYFPVSQSTSESIGGNTKWEIYDYPGDFAHLFKEPDKRLDKIQPEGEKIVKIRQAEEDAAQKILHGTSDARTFVSGGKFDLTEHPTAAGKYVLTAIHHTAHQSPDFFTHTTVDDPYHNSFTAIPDGIAFRPPRVTPKPVIHGLQNAVVVGAQGKEIDVDKYGRVIVQFPWDREGKKDQNSSCRVRVAQFWAGKRWGASFWPRIGQEVLVAFLEGDPDRPIVVGSVYNADQMPPYLGEGLDSKHKNDPNVSGVKSNTTLGGKGFNEWRFDDTKGKEQIFMHAERDMDVRVKNESRERVISNRHLIVGWKSDGGEQSDGAKQGGDQRELVNQDKHLNVKRDQQEKIEGNYFLTVGKGEADDGGRLQTVLEKDRFTLIGGQDQLHVQKAQFVGIDDEQHLTVAKDKLESLGMNSHLDVKMNRNEKVGMTQSLQVGMNQYEKVGMSHALDSGMTIHLKSGLTFVLEAGVQLSLKVGGNFIDINPAGIFIQGTLVMINSGGAPGSGSGSSPTDPDPANKPEDAQEAKPTKPAVADDSKSGMKSAPG